MRAVRVAFPALIGLILLYVAFQSVQSALAGSGESVMAAAQGGTLLGALGAGFLLVALAVSSGSRSGFFLGLGTAILMVLGGVLVIVIELPYVGQGGLGGAIGGGVIIFAGIWILVSLAYFLAIRRARASFAPSMDAGDRRLGIVLGGLAMFAAAAWVAFGAIDTQQVAAGADSRGAAQVLVAGTSLEVAAPDVSVDRASGTDSHPTVLHMIVDVAVTSPERYELAAVPTLCLTDLATAEDPAYKPDTYCWGSQGRAIALDRQYPRLMVDEGSVAFQVELDREGLCSFGSGLWNADLRLVPRMTPDTAENDVEAFTLSAQFQVGETGHGPDAPSGPTTDCFASTVSP